MPVNDRYILVYHIHLNPHDFNFTTWSASPVKIDFAPVANSDDGRETCYLGFNGSAIIVMDPEDAKAMAREILKHGSD